MADDTARETPRSRKRKAAREAVNDNDRYNRAVPVEDLPLSPANDNRGAEPEPEVLPPPVDTLLWFAIQGWARENPQVVLQGLSRMPPRSEWLPPFLRILRSDDAKERVKALTMIGIEAYSDEDTMLQTIARAFETDGIEEDLADQIAVFAARLDD